jgi:type II secretory pathway pseudopilin PulG
MTLLEVLIAVTLFAILSVGIFTALRIGLTSMNHANDRLMANRRSAYAARILESEINGLMPEWAVFQPTPQSPIQSLLFFQGEPQNMRFVSSYSIQDASRGIPQVLEFTVIPGADSGVRLVVNERVYTGPTSAGAACAGFAMDPLSNMRVPLFRPIVVGPTSFVLADKLAFCRFLFERPPIANIPGGWVDHWVRPDWPVAVRIEMGPLEPDPMRLQPMTVTSEIHVNKMQGIDYADN